MEELANGGNQICVIDNKSVVISEVENGKCTIKCGEGCNLLIMDCALKWLKYNNTPLNNGAYIDSFSRIKSATNGTTIYLINVK